MQQCMKNMLASFTKHRHILHAGYTFAGQGSWILQVRRTVCRLLVRLHFAGWDLLFRGLCQDI